MKFDIENYKRVLHYASIAHNGQLMPTGMPYVYHITSVAVEVLGSYLNEPESFIGDINLSTTCALLHDTIEDTKISFSDIESEFGIDVANGVFALTKEKYIGNKDDQMKDSIKKLLAQPYEIQCIKLADRITNLSNVPEKWSADKLNKYVNEASFILEMLGQSNKYLANRLKLKIEELQEVL